MNDENYHPRIHSQQQNAKLAAIDAVNSGPGNRNGRRKAFQNITNTAANEAARMRNAKEIGQKPSNPVYNKPNEIVIKIDSEPAIADDETEDEEVVEDDEQLMDVSRGNIELDTDNDDDSEENEEKEFWAPTLKDSRELARVHAEFSNKPGIWDEDDEDSYDISMVSEYGVEIFEYMRTLEIEMQPDAAYMDHHDEIHWGMRRVLLDWLVQVHSRFRLLPETLFLAVNYMDRFLTIKSNVSTNKLQLVGAVSLFIAAKYEEINCPSVQEMVYMVENFFSVDQILKAEQYMIDLLEFKLGWPGPMSFLRRTSKADDYELEIRTLAKYLLEITIMDEQYVACPASYLAACSYCMSRIMLERMPSWSDAHVFFSGYTFNQLLPGLRILWSACINPESHHKAIYQKYQDKKFRRASLYVAQYVGNLNGEMPEPLL